MKLSNEQIAHDLTLKFLNDSLKNGIVNNSPQYKNIVSVYNVLYKSFLDELILKSND